MTLTFTLYPVMPVSLELPIAISPFAPVRVARVGRSRVVRPKALTVRSAPLVQPRQFLHAAARVVQASAAPRLAVANR